MSCIQVNSNSPCIPSGEPFSKKDKSPNCPFKHPVDKQSEDCLFLDIYVPLSVITGNVQVPVVVWIYGGAYLFGSKQQFDTDKLPLYTGQGLLEATKESVIFVAGNYRVGAFGWLAGSYMEEKAVSNVGLYDQRKTLQFVQNYIHLVNGDKTRVSAWGESAGAGSIMHHLTAMNGEQDPLFSKAVLQSPAWEWVWDRRGTANRTYSRFAEFASCPNGQIECLQSATEDTLRAASQKLFQTETACNGIYPVGPALDGTWVKTLPAVALKTSKSTYPPSIIALLIQAADQYWKKMDSLIVSHVQDEVGENSSFMPAPLKNHSTPENFNMFLKAFMPQSDLGDLRNQINRTYSSQKFRNDQLLRAATIIRDSSFTCNTRQLFNAYNSSNVETYMIFYSFLSIAGAATHASDLIPTFVNQYTDVKTFIKECAEGAAAKLGAGIVAKYLRTQLAPAFQSYLISHAVFGDPNKAAVQAASQVHWKPARTRATDQGEHIFEVLTVNDLPVKGVFSSGQRDDINVASVCNFWDNVALAIMDKYGSANATTPGGVDISSLFQGGDLLNVTSTLAPGDDSSNSTETDSSDFSSSSGSETSTATGTRFVGSVFRQ